MPSSLKSANNVKMACVQHGRWANSTSYESETTDDDSVDTESETQAIPAIEGAKKDSGFGSQVSNDAGLIFSDNDEPSDDSSLSSSSSTYVNPRKRSPDPSDDDDASEEEEEEEDEDDSENDDDAKKASDNEDEGPYPEIAHCRMKFENFQLLGRYLVLTVTV